MGRLNITILEPAPEKADALLMDAIFATQGRSEVVEVVRMRDPEKIQKITAKTPAVLINKDVKVFSGGSPREEIKKWVAEIKM